MAVQTAAGPFSQLRAMPDLQGIGAATSPEVEGARTLEVTQWLHGQLLSVHQLGTHDRWLRIRLPLQIGGALFLATGIGLAHASPAIAALLLSAGVALLTVAHCLREPRMVQNLGTGRPLLRRCSHGDFELLVPCGARSELVSASGAIPFEMPACPDRSDEVAVAIPPVGAVRMLLGELEVRVAWTHPLRRPPPSSCTQRRWRWPVAALALSYLMHQILLLLVFTVPPGGHIIADLCLDLCEDPITRVSRPRLEFPCGTDGQGCVFGRLDPALITAHGHCEGGVADRPWCHAAPEERCTGPVPRPMVYAGHVRASGQRAVGELQRPFRNRARTLERCYRAALARCAGPGRMVFSLEIDHHGRVVSNQLESSWWSSSSDLQNGFDHQELVLCVGDVIETWKLRSVSEAGMTRARLPLIFRYAGAPSRPALARVR